MTADHDQVACLFLGQVVDLLAWLAIGQVAVFLGQLRVLVDQPIETLPGLVELLLLQLREIHRDVTAESHGHGLDNMHQGQLGPIAHRQLASTMD
ncbi:hypothetical protein AO265_04140, partial [Pseudomonas sp. ABAC61]